MKLCFDSIEETREFVKQLKTSRGKGDKDEGETGGAAAGQAPAPLAPPASAMQFAPGATAAFTPPAGAAFPSAAPQLDPALQALVNRITTRIDGAIQSGQPADQVLAWFRGQCGPEAANATMDQIKTIFLPKAAPPTLENIAKLMNA